MRFSVDALVWRNKTAKLEIELVEAKKRIEQLEGEVEAFWTGKIEEGASLSMCVLARWGRKRLEEMKKVDTEV